MASFVGNWKENDQPGPCVWKYKIIKIKQQLFLALCWNLPSSFSKVFFLCGKKKLQLHFFICSILRAFVNFFRILVSAGLWAYNIVVRWLRARSVLFFLSSKHFSSSLQSSWLPKFLNVFHWTLIEAFPNAAECSSLVRKEGTHKHPLTTLKIRLAHPKRCISPDENFTNIFSPLW